MNQLFALECGFDIFDTRTYHTLHPFLFATETSTPQKRHFQVGLYFLFFLDCEGTIFLNLIIIMKWNRTDANTAFVFLVNETYTTSNLSRLKMMENPCHIKRYEYSSKKAQEGKNISLWKKTGENPTAKNKNPQ